MGPTSRILPRKERWCEGGRDTARRQHRTGNAVPQISRPGVVVARWDPALLCSSRVYRHSWRGIGTWRVCTVRMQQLYQGRCALHALAAGAWSREGQGWCVLQLVEIQPGQYQLIGRDSTNPQSVRMAQSIPCCVPPYGRPPAACRAPSSSVTASSRGSATRAGACRRYCLTC
jgi:hypothetical protein